MEVLKCKYVYILTCSDPALRTPQDNTKNNTVTVKENPEHK